MMKRGNLSAALFLCLTALLFVAGCTQVAQPSVPPLEIAESIAAGQPDPDVFYLRMAPGEDIYEVYLTGLYGIDAELVEDGAIFAASGVQAQEIAVLRLRSEDGAQQAASLLTDYAQGRYNAFYGYAPEQAALVENANVAVSGGYVALLICDDMAAAESAFRDCFYGYDLQLHSAAPEPESQAEYDEAGGTETGDAETGGQKPAYDENGYIIYDPPGEVDMTIYDTGAILTAYAAGDASGLFPKDQAILTAAEEVIAQVITEGMTDYEKELAIHDWMILWADYDEGVYSGTASADGNNPYGLLVEKKGRCLGYATTFQLLMDMLGIECRTVVGAATGSTRDHAWNMVRLEDEWYCVDVTWDDPIGGDATAENIAERRHHRHFNVTSDYMRSTDRQWDYDAAPEATGTKYAYSVTK